MTEKLTKTIEIEDPWGTVHRAHVTWVPRPLSGVDEARENNGNPFIAWRDEDDCPVLWELAADTRCAQLIAPSRQFRGDVELVVAPNRAGSTRGMEPGDYCVTITAFRPRSCEG